MYHKKKMYPSQNHVYIYMCVCVFKVELFISKNNITSILHSRWFYYFINSSRRLPKCLQKNGQLYKLYILILNNFVTELWFIDVAKKYILF